MSGKLTGACWSDESRGLQTCNRDALAEVNVNGYGALGCTRCKTVLGEPVAPATAQAEQFANGWRKIPRDWFQ